MLSAKSKSILMFFPWNGTHPQDAFAGVSDFDYDDHMLEDFVAAATIKPAVLQIECHPYAQRRDVRARAAKLGIQVETWFPLGGGGKGNRALLNDPVILDMAKMHGKTSAQIILRGHVQEGFSVIPGSNRPRRLLHPRHLARRPRI